MKIKRTYKIRYSVERWGKSLMEPSERIAKGVRITKSNYGYADALFVMSILHDEKGAVESTLMVDTETGPNLSQAMIDLVRSQLDHYEKDHLGKPLSDS